MAQKLLVSQRMTERWTLADAVELDGERLGPDRIASVHSRPVQPFGYPAPSSRRGVPF
jgi:hypothetical protein